MSTKLKTVPFYLPPVLFMSELKFAFDKVFFEFGKCQCPELVEIASTGPIATNKHTVFFKLHFWPILGQNIESAFSKMNT